MKNWFERSLFKQRKAMYWVSDALARELEGGREDEGGAGRGWWRGFARHGGGVNVRF